MTHLHLAFGTGKPMTPFPNLFKKDLVSNPTWWGVRKNVNPAGSSRPRFSRVPPGFRVERVEWQAKIHIALAVLAGWIIDKHRITLHLVNQSQTLAPGLRSWWAYDQQHTSLGSYATSPVSNSTRWEVRLNINPMDSFRLGFLRAITR